MCVDELGGIVGPVLVGIVERLLREEPGLDLIRKVCAHRDIIG